MQSLLHQEHVIKFIKDDLSVQFVNVVYLRQLTPSGSFGEGIVHLILFLILRN